MTQQSSKKQARKKATAKTTRSSSNRAGGRRSEVIVVSVGGSLIVPDQIDTSFLLSLKRCLMGYTKSRKRFILVTGGGAIGRMYQQAAARISRLSSAEVDQVGIHATHLNARLLNTIFRTYSSKEIIVDPTRPIRLTSQKPLAIAGGWKPGWSTDYVAVRLAQQAGAERLINLTDIDYVYNKDPEQYSDAYPIKEITWTEFRKLIPKNWDPGLSSPFDPVASQEAQKLGMEVAVINGRKLAQFEHYLSERTFRGTLIKPEASEE